jgi:hypothetical protein
MVGGVAVADAVPRQNRTRNGFAGEADLEVGLSKSRLYLCDALRGTGRPLT